MLQRNVLLTLSEGIALSDVREAAELTEKAVKLAKSAKLEPLRIAEALAEHAVATWFSSERNAAFDALQAGVQILMEDTQAALWKKTFLLFLHIAGYFGSVTLTGSPPTPTFEKPRRGMFLSTDNISEDLYKPLQHSILFIRLAMFADGIGNTLAADTWAKRALGDSSEVSSTPPLVLMLSWLRVAPALLNEDWQTPVEVAELMRHFSSVSAQSFDELGITSEADRARFSQNTAETVRKDRGFHHAILPLVVALANLRFQRSITEDVIEVKELLQQRSDSPSSDWNEMADLVEAVFASNSKWEDFYQKVTTYYAQGRIGFGMVAAVGSILYSPLAQSLMFQIGLAENLDKLFVKSCSIWTRVIEPFFLSYWMSAAANGDPGFRTAPSYSQRRVSEISGSPQGGRLRWLLREMVFCVGLRLSDEHSAWLEAEQ